MTKPPIQKTTLGKPVKTTIRLSAEAHAELQATATLHKRSMNAELMARIQGGQIVALRRDVAELKVMVGTILDILRDR